MPTATGSRSRHDVSLPPAAPMADLDSRASTAAARGVADIVAAAQRGELAVDEALRALAARAEHRGDGAARRAAGAYFTASDVCDWIVARTLLPAAASRAAMTALVECLDYAAIEGRDPWRLVEALTDTERRRLACGAARLVVLDPACGAGAFLVAAWRALQRLGADADPARLVGVDVEPNATEACAAAVALVAGASPTTVVGDVLDVGAPGGRDVLDTFLPGGADVLLGNPPFVRRTVGTAPAGIVTAAAGNLAAWIVERALDHAAPGARAGFVLPVSVACTDAFACAREHWSRRCARILASHYDTIPSGLFLGVVQRVSIFLGAVRDTDDRRPARWYTSRYHRFLRDERERVLDGVRHVPLPAHSVGGSIAKIGSVLEARLLGRLFRHPPAGRFHASRCGASDGRLLYKRRWSYYLLFCDFEPPVWDESGHRRPPSELKELQVAGIDPLALVAVYSSSLFWWFFSVFTDNRNVNRRDLAAFPLPDLEPAIECRLAAHGRDLMRALRASAEVRTCTYASVGTIRNTYFRQAETRPVIDEIDRELARIYDMDEAELAFVLGYERRFRRDAALELSGPAGMSQ